MTDFTLRSIPENYGTLMTMDEFIEASREGRITNYSGAGRLATQDGYSQFIIRPSSVVKLGEKFQKPDGFTHVMWFDVPS